MTCFQLLISTGGWRVVRLFASVDKTYLGICLCQSLAGEPVVSILKKFVMIMIKSVSTDNEYQINNFDTIIIAIVINNVSLEQ